MHTAAATVAGVPSASAGAVLQKTWGALISLRKDGSDGDRYPLGGEWSTIGRAGADIEFANDRFLARHHARLDSSGPRVIPLDRLNGVYRRIEEPLAISDGTLLLLGREVLRFELITDDERHARPLVRHGVALFGSPPREPWGRLLQILANGGVRDIRHLSDPRVTIGREEGELIFSDDAFLSRRHATLTWHGGRCIIEDLGSSNGTFVRLAGPTLLNSGDHLRMGDQLFRFEIASQPGSMP